MMSRITLYREVVFIEGLCKPHVWSLKMFSLHTMLIKSLHPKFLAWDSAVKGKFSKMSIFIKRTPSEYTDRKSL